MKAGNRLTLVNPVSAFRKRMAAVRTNYYAEALLDRKEAALVKAQQAKERAAKEAALLADIAAFKRSQEYNSFAAAAAEAEAETEADDPIRAALGADSTDPAPAPHQQAQAAYIARRAAIRAATETARQTQLQQARERSLLYLLYATDSFVTLETLDDRIDKCLQSKHSAGPSSLAKADFSAGTSFSTLARLAKQVQGASSDASDVEAYSALPNGVETSSHSHAAMVLKKQSPTSNTSKDLERERRGILSDIALGRVAGRDGPDTIKASVGSV
ncbi:hypothetical protein BDR26DRAFT_855688 [Obelidium mucronatum]|nr:hypothetical protein BDR26DRAFT_855688 [Obelidium mucronatum]